MGWDSVFCFARFNCSNCLAEPVDLVMFVRIVKHHVLDLRMVIFSYYGKSPSNPSNHHLGTYVWNLFQASSRVTKCNLRGFTPNSNFHLCSTSFPKTHLPPQIRQYSGHNFYTSPFLQGSMNDWLFHPTLFFVAT